MENTVTFEQAVEMLKVTRQTVYNYIEKGLLKPRKAFNNRVYFDLDEVNELIKLPFTDPLEDVK
jgi:predicted site-specific integrase-resolvase